jgi:transcription elongation GreA/GreB family factor
MWPMTAEARRALVDHVVDLRSDVAHLAGRIDGDEVVDRLPVATLARRLEVLTRVLDAAEETDGRDRVVIGCRAVLREQDGRSVTYSVAFPGAGDPANGSISADSPLGRAILGARTGDKVEVDAPAGRRVVTVVSVE